MTLLSEPFCVVTDDITYQEKIEALIGAISDYDDVIDNTPDYFDYDDHRDYEEWCGWNDPADDNSSGYFDNSSPHVCEEWCGWDGQGMMGCVVTPTVWTSLMVSLPFPENRDWLFLMFRTAHFLSCRILMGSPKCPCMDSGIPSPVLFSSRVRTLQCRIIPDFGSGHPWTSRSRN